MILFCFGVFFAEGRNIQECTRQIIFVCVFCYIDSRIIAISNACLKYVNFPAFLFRCPALLVVGDTSPAVEAVVSDRFQYSVLKQQTETSNYL